MLREFPAMKKGVRLETGRLRRDCRFCSHAATQQRTYVFVPTICAHHWERTASPVVFTLGASSQFLTLAAGNRGDIAAAVALLVAAPFDV